MLVAPKTLSKCDYCLGEERIFVLLVFNVAGNRVGNAKGDGEIVNDIVYE